MRQGLVDRLGGLYEAIGETRILLDLAADAPVDISYYPHPKSGFDVLIESLEERFSFLDMALGQIGAWLAPGMARMPSIDSPLH